MNIIAQILIGIVAFLHFYIFTFETFFWEQRGPKVFRSVPKEMFPKTTSMMKNQGVYNLFLALGLLWTFFIKDGLWQQNIALFFLCCVAVAGIVGALTAEKRIFFVQSVPALLGILALLAL